MTEKTTEQIVEEFFRRRFPEKYIKFEIECGYFGEWVRRFQGGSPEDYMDKESLKVWEQMKNEEINNKLNLKGTERQVFI